MKKILFIVVIVLAILFGLEQIWSQAAKSTSPTKELMRQKLAHSQSVLEGVAMEDFELVAKHSRKLRAVSQQSGWALSDSPDYERHTDNFRRNVDALAKAADERSLDGVTLAYVKMTMNCVECHKFVRGRKTARLEEAGSLLRFSSSVK